MIGTYNCRRNDPYITDHEHPNWHAQAKVYEPITADDAGRLPDFRKKFFDPAKPE